ncbi:MAG: hypothetical protein HY849_01040 [Nitrosomonadales bacterium]|nr:hypothetical protein [Nitrosomonadales bacterium]
MNKNVTVIMAVIFTLTGCPLQITAPSWRALQKKLETQEMVIEPYRDEASRRRGVVGFYVSMKASVASKMGAPNSEEFKKALEVQLQKERLDGNVYCPQGYSLYTNMVYGTDATILMDCK